MLLKAVDFGEMRRDNRRKSGKRKSFEAEKQNRTEPNGTCESELVINCDLSDKDLKTVEELKSDVESQDQEETSEVEIPKENAVFPESFGENNASLNGKKDIEDDPVDPDKQEPNPEKSDIVEANKCNEDLSKSKSFGFDKRNSPILKDENEEEFNEAEKNRQKILSKATNEAALRLYSR